MNDSNLLFVGRTGSAISPIITVQDETGAVIDISTASEITLSFFADPSQAASLVKKLSTNGIAFVTDGTDGKFQAVITNADAANLKGFYNVTGDLTDAQGNTSPIVSGRCQFGPFPDWSYTGDPKASTKDLVRFYAGDTNSDDPLVSDAEINAAIATRANAYGAAAEICRSLAARFSRDQDSSMRDVRDSYSQRASAFAKRSSELEGKSFSLQFGGIGVSGLLGMFP